MNLTEINMFGIKGIKDWYATIEAIAALRKAWNKKDYSSFEEAVKLLAKTFGLEEPSKELLEMIEAAKESRWTDVAENGAELVLAVIEMMRGQVSRTMMSLMTAATQGEDFDEVLFLLNCTPSTLASVDLTKQDSESQAIPIPVIIGLVRLFIEWRRYKKG